MAERGNVIAIFDELDLAHQDDLHKKEVYVSDEDVRYHSFEEFGPHRSIVGEVSISNDQGDKEQASLLECGHFVLCSENDLGVGNIGCPHCKDGAPAALKIRFTGAKTSSADLEDEDISLSYDSETRGITVDILDKELFDTMKSYRPEMRSQFRYQPECPEYSGQPKISAMYKFRGADEFFFTDAGEFLVSTNQGMSWATIKQPDLFSILSNDTGSQAEAFSIMQMMKATSFIYVSEGAES